MNIHTWIVDAFSQAFFMYGTYELTEYAPIVYSLNQLPKDNVDR